MPNRFFRKEPSRIFLGTLAVAPRSDIKSSLEQWTLFNRNTEDLDEGLRRSLEEIFIFPLAINVSDPKPTDLVIDVMVPDFQGGEFEVGEFGLIPLAAIWRPKVKVAARLYYLKSKKTKSAANALSVKCTEGAPNESNSSHRNIELVNSVFCFCWFNKNIGLAKKDI